MKLRMKPIAGLFVVAATAGCGFDYLSFLDDLFGQPESGIAGLKRFASEQELKDYLVTQQTLMRGGFGMPEFFDDMSLGVTDGAMALEDEAPVAAPNTTGATDSDSTSGEGGDVPAHSTTTEQEPGVQEADIIKNDGEYLYILSRDLLRIVKATPVDAMTEVAAVELEGSGQDLYLVGNRAVAITAASWWDEDDSVSSMPDDVATARSVYQGPQTDIVVIDVTDPTNPAVLSRSRFDGSVSASRMIDDMLYLVVVNEPEILFIPGIDIGIGMDGPMETGMGMMRTTETSLAEVPLADILPDVSITVDGKEAYSGDIAVFDDFFRPIDPDGSGITNIVSMNIEAPLNYRVQSVVAYPANVYASTKALYLTDTDYSNLGEVRETTDIYKFAYSDDGPVLAAVGSVPGRVLNQYSMSEHNGFLRLATTKSGSFSGPFGMGLPTNSVYVCEQLDDRLVVTGSVEGLAPGETIFAARFQGTKGYLVTFEQVDPLFTLDLSDPRNPVAVGELKVPGFSNFIVPMGENHLLTVGQSTNNDFGWARPVGVQLSIFDVSEFANPKLAYSELIGENGAWSEALNNPKAFTYFAEGDLLALPVEIGNFMFATDGIEPFMIEDATDGNADDGSDFTDAGSNGMEPDEPDADEPLVPDDFFQGLYVYRVTTGAGFEFLGRISTLADSADMWYYGPQFTRGAFIGQTVYAVTSDGVYAASIDAVDTVLSTALFPLPEDEFPMPIPLLE